MQCKYCGEELTNEVVTCPKCGKDLKEEAVKVENNLANNPSDITQPSNSDSPKKKSSKKLLICALSFIVIAIVCSLSYVLSGNLRKYNQAKKLLENKQYNEAIDAFVELGDYKESKTLHNESLYKKGEKFLSQEDYDSAIEIFAQLGEYDNASKKLKECYYILGDSQLDGGNYIEASNYFSNAIGYQDAEEKYNTSIYTYAKELVKEYKYSDAKTEFDKIDYKDSKELAKVYGDLETNRYSNNKFYYQPEELALILSNNLPTGYSAEYQNEKDGIAIINIYKNKVKTDKNFLLHGVDLDSGTFTQLTYLDTNVSADSEAWAHISVLLVQATNQSIAFDACKDLVQELFGENVSATEIDGIEYSSAYVKNSYFLTAKIMNS